MSRKVATVERFWLKLCLMLVSSWAIWSVVLHPLRNPAWAVLMIPLASRNQCNQLAISLSKVFPRLEVRDTGRYELGSSAGLPFFSRGITTAFFHCAGT